MGIKKQLCVSVHFSLLLPLLQPNRPLYLYHWKVHEEKEQMVVLDSGWDQAEQKLIN